MTVPAWSTAGPRVRSRAPVARTQTLACSAGRAAQSAAAAFPGLPPPGSVSSPWHSKKITVSMVAAAAAVTVRGNIQFKFFKFDRGSAASEARHSVALASPGWHCD